MCERDAAEYESDESELLLSRIAAALDCPVEAFSDPSSLDRNQTVELLRLWAMLKDEQDRSKVLSFLRGVAPRTSLPGGP